jgi:hypothetical protein
MKPVINSVEESRGCGSNEEVPEELTGISHAGGRDRKIQRLVEDSQEEKPEGYEETWLA